MKEKTKRMACPLCDSSICPEKTARIYVSPFNRQEYRLHTCANCKLGFWTPLKVVSEFYESEGFSAYTAYHQGERPFPKWSLPFFEHIPISNGKLLDVGCGDGAFLARARSFGFETFGIDIDKKSIHTAMTTFGLENIAQSALNDFVRNCLEKQMSFDVISFFEVLEHQDNPSAFLDEILKILKPGGYIAGSVPNAKRFLADLDRKISPGDLPPHHFLWFSEQTIRLFFVGRKLNQILIRPSGNISLMELSDKLMLFISNRLHIHNEPALPLRIVLRPIVNCAACSLWVGYKVRPAHLYFQARKMASSK